MTSQHNLNNRKSPIVAVIVLNWNGWRDTIECLESLYQQECSSYQIIVVDNGSTDNSLKYIEQWAQGNLFLTSRFLEYDRIGKPIFIVRYSKEKAESGGTEISESKLLKLTSNKRMILTVNNTNLGFAMGVNVGIRYALKHNFEFMLVLNNDTVIEKNALRNMISHMLLNKSVGALTAQINYYDSPDLIWNTGGYLTAFGNRKYYNHNTIDNGQQQKNYPGRVTFVTGCALLIRRSVFKKYGLFTEKFFFGEEDFEFSLRMKKYGVCLACCTNSRVYHKMEKSCNQLFKQRINYAFVHHLSRFINMKEYYPYSFWKIWRYLSLLYLLPMLHQKYKLGFKTLLIFSKKLIRYSITQNQVTRKIVLQILNERF